MATCSRRILLVVLILARSLSLEFAVEVALQPETAKPADISATTINLLLPNLFNMLTLLFAESCLT